MKSARLFTTVLAFLICTYVHATTFEEKIVFTSNKLGDVDIWIINPDGTGLEPFVVKPNTQNRPKLSPDGTILSYWDKSSGASRVVILDLATGTETELFETSQTGSHNYTWTSDNLGLILQWPFGCNNEDLYLLDLQGNLGLWYDGPAARQAPWSMDDFGVIYFTSDPCNSANTQVTAYDSVYSSVTVVQPADGRIESQGTVSRDGSWLAYGKADSSFYRPHRIFVMPSGGGPEQRISFNASGASDEYPSFSPDGSRLVYVRLPAPYGSAPTDLIVVDRDGTNETVILDESYVVGNPNWGSMLVSVSPTYSCSGFQSPADNGPITVRGNRAIPLKAHLFDESGIVVSDLRLISPPVAQVLFISAVGEDPIDVTDQALPPGSSSEGNQFQFGDGIWQFNLKAGNYSATGTYLVSMRSGDEAEYVIDPSCEVSFVVR